MEYIYEYINNIFIWKSNKINCILKLIENVYYIFVAASNDMQS